MFDWKRVKELVAASALWLSYFLGRQVSNRLRRFLILDLIQYSRRAYPPTSVRQVLQMPGSTMLKMSSFSRSLTREAENMRFIARHTTIPVPEVLDLWRATENRTYMVTKKVPGRTLQSVFADLTPNQRVHIARQLKGFIDQIRSLPPTIPGAVCSLSGGPFREDRLELEDIGPFANEKEFHNWRVSLAGDLDRRAAAHHPNPHRTDAIRANLRDDHDIVFTHGDLNPSNILVEITGGRPTDARIVAVIDWEMSGWRPEYWEYVKCMHVLGRQRDWAEFVQMIVPAYPEEHGLDDQLQRFTGEPF